MSSNSLISILKNPVKFKLFLLKKLPMGYLAGLKVEEISESKVAISIKYKYLTQNPFRSIYFACLAMAGELASGALSIIHASSGKPTVSMLVVNMNATFQKKAVGKIVFVCEEGNNIKAAIEEAKKTGEGVTYTATSIGRDEEGDIVAEFKITWSYKSRKS